MSEQWATVREWPNVILEARPDDGIARIVLNRPEKRNALNQTLVDGIFAALEEVRADKRIRVVITSARGPSYSAGLDLHFLRDLQNEGVGDWDRPSPTARLFAALREFPRVTIAQVHGHCLGGSLALMNSHDLVVAARSAQIGMPEILRGSFGQMATSTLYHAGVPMKKAALMQFTGRNVSGEEAERWGLVSLVADDEELEAATTQLALEIGPRHPAALANAKIAAQMGRDLSLPAAMQLDRLVYARQQLMVDPLEHVDNYLRSQSGGTNLSYRRPDA